MAEDQVSEDAPRYEPPQIIEIGVFAEMTKGQYSRNRSDDGDAGGYFPG
jgi:hypothetical protein